MLIIIAVVSCASILEASGCLKCMLQYAERMLRKDPKRSLSLDQWLPML